MDALTKTDLYAPGVWCTLSPYGDIGMDPDVRPFLNANRVIIVKRTKSGLIQIRLPGDYKNTISVPQRNVDIIPAERLRQSAGFIDYDVVVRTDMLAARMVPEGPEYEAIRTLFDLEDLFAGLHEASVRVHARRRAEAAQLCRRRLHRRLQSNRRIKWRGQLIRATPQADTRRYLIEARKRCWNQ